jgi:hypothetical protein
VASISRSDPILTLFSIPDLKATIREIAVMITEIPATIAVITSFQAINPSLIYAFKQNP